MEQTQTINENPFLPPSQTLHSLENDNEAKEAYYFDASTGKRFLNFIIDRVVGAAFTALVVVLLSLWAFFVADDPELESLKWMDIYIWDLIFTTLIYLVYLMFFEAVFGFSIGKLITGTRVVKLKVHEKPDFATIFIRNICRVIPFEPFSFLGGTPRGWHDTISKTRVVDIRKGPLQNEDYELLPDYLKNT